MASEIRSFTVLTPAGVQKAAPLITPMAMPPRIVREIEIRVPPGPNGELGFAIGMAGQAIIPFNAGEWIVTSDEIVKWQFDTPLNSGAWQCQSYNTGNYPHTIQIRFYLDLVVVGSTPGPAAYVDLSGISSSTSTDGTTETATVI